MEFSYEKIYENVNYVDAVGVKGLTKAGVDQNSVYSLSLEQNTGHPRFQWKALPTDNEFEVARYHRGRIIGCPDSVELQEYINDINITKCFKLVKVNTNSSENYLLEYDSERGFCVIPIKV